MIFLDTNVLLYAVTTDPAFSDKRRRAVDILCRTDLAISAQVLAEFYANATKKMKLGIDPAAASEFLDEIIADMPCDPVDAALVTQGAAVSQRYQISYWDGAIIASARRMGCAALWSEDLNTGQTYDGVTVQNPFL